MRHAIKMLGVIILAASGGYALGKAPVSPKAYIIAEVTVTDPEAYKTYAPLAAAAVAAHGGRYLARGGAVTALEGGAPAPRYAIVEFANVAAANAFYTSAAYQAAAKIRRSASRSRFWIVEGVATPARQKRER